MRTKCFFRQLEANVTTRRFELDEQNNFRSEALFLLFRSSIFYSLSLSLSLARSLAPNLVIVPAVMISSQREIIFAPIHWNGSCPRGNGGQNGAFNSFI